MFVKSKANKIYLHNMAVNNLHLYLIHHHIGGISICNINIQVSTECRFYV